jgi:protein-tyrosine-phosphatase
VESAGTWAEPGLPISAPALKVAARLGLPGLDAHLTREVNQALLDQFDLILVMEMDHLEAMSIEFSSIFGRLMLLSEIADGLIYSIADPAKQKSDPQEIASDLQKLIKRGGKKILKMAQALHQARQISVKSD